MKKIVILLNLFVLVLLSACSQKVDNATADSSMNEPADPVAVYFISPQDGDELTSPVTIRFGLKGMGVAPAGTVRDNTGHHHLIIDAELPDLSLPIPASDNYIHFGGGQTQVTIELTPGQHSLQLLMGNAYHIPHEAPLVSKKITVNVR